MVTDPYNDDDDDDEPTLQRPAPRSGARNDSGIRAAVTMPAPANEADEVIECAFGEETTAVDLARIPEAPSERVDAVPSAAPLSSPADGEVPTPSVPLDVATVLLQFAGTAEQPRREREE